MNDLRLRAASAALLCLLSPLAQAAPITWTFTGIVQALPGGPVPPALGSLGVAVGAAVTGSVRFESDTPKLFPNDPTVGNYAGAVDQANVTIGSWSLSEDPSPVFNDVIVSNASEPGEFFQVNMVESTGSVSLPFFALELSKPPPTIWPGQAMLLTPPPLSQLDPFGPDGSTAWGYGTDAVLFAGDLELRIELTSLVPEPEVAALVAGLLVGLAAVRKSTQG
jgi:hypothetical protein